MRAISGAAGQTIDGEAWLEGTKGAGREHPASNSSKTAGIHTLTLKTLQHSG
jgi:hypothetical protein